jgi:DNA-binding response OmpR family regulator
MAQPRNILIVDDELLIAMGSETVVTDLGHRAFLAHTAEDALKAIRTDSMDLVLLDLMLQGRESVSVAQELLDRNIPFIVCSGSNDPSSPIFEHAPYLMKPCRDADLAAAIDEIL